MKEQEASPALAGIENSGAPNRRNLLLRSNRALALSRTSK